MDRKAEDILLSQVCVELGGLTLGWTGETEGSGHHESSSNEDTQGEEAVDADMFSIKGAAAGLIVC